PSELQDHASARGPSERRRRFQLAVEGTLVLRIEQTEPTVGIEPTPSRVRAECPCLQDLAGVEWAEGVEPSPSAWGADVLSVDTTPTSPRRSGPLVVEDLVQRVQDFNEVGLVGHDLIDVLVGGGDLIDERVRSL